MRYSVGQRLCYSWNPARLFVCLCLVVFSTLLCGISSPAYPWRSKGHEIVAVIAETHLTDAARKRIKELLPQGTILADASTWPDKAGRQIPDMDPYHYINFPKDANTYDQQRDCKQRNCVIEAIAWYLQVLKSPDAPGNEKRTALRFVAHLVGDISDELQQWQQGTVADSALESLAIVRAQVHRLPASREINPNYIEAARAVIRTRLAQAGARLASLLNGVLK